jgi:hypothetical protein
MWEYKRKDFISQLYSDLVEQLNKEGENNWELIYYQEERAEKYNRDFTVKTVFKRQKENPACIKQEKQQ